MMHFCQSQLGDRDNLETLRFLLRVTLESTADGALITGAGSGIIAFSTRFAEMWHVPASLVENPDTAGILSHLESQIRMPGDLANRLKHPTNGESFSGLATLVDGRQFECRTTPGTFDMSGVRIWTFRDVTNQIVIERTLEANERRYQTLFRESHDAILLVAFNGSILDANRAALDICGRTRAELIATNFQELCVQSAILMSQVRDHGEVREYEVKIRRPDGSIRSCLINAISYAEQAGEPVGIQGHLHDVTERKRLEEQLRLWQRMEAIGRLAGGVAHDFNNLLTAVTGYGEFLKEQLAGSSLEPDIEEILKASRSAASLTRQLLAFSRQQVLQPRVLSLNEILLGTRGLLRRLIGEHILFEFDLTDDTPHVRADPGQLEQVVINLVVNARDAMSEGGTVTMRTAILDMGPHDVAPLQPMPPGRYARLSIADTGHGMDDIVRSQIFEPFFTTKELGKGTGLGLATVYGVVKQSDGFIWVDSAPGKGTTFSIYLPLVVAPASPEQVEAADKPQGAKGTETVLVVEDESFVLALIVRTLKQHGYHVIHAQNGPEALRLMETAGHIDALVTDVVMPHMSGLELSRQISRMRPQVRTVYMSGYSSGVEKMLLADPMRRSFLQKPFAPMRLLKTIRQLLDRTVAADA